MLSCSMISKKNISNTEDHSLLPIDKREIAPNRDVTDSFALYMQQVNKYELLSPQQEQILTRQLIQTGDIEMAKQLVTANLKLVIKIAMEYRFAWQNIMDLIQEGNIGLMKAVSKYNPEKGAKLSYYASWWIKSYILKFILDNFRLVKIGTTNEQKKLFYNLLKEKDRLLCQGVEPDIKLLSQNLGVSEKAVSLMDQRLGPSGSEVSIDAPIKNEIGSQTFADLLSDGEEHSPEEIVSNAQNMEILRSHLHNFVKSLNKRDQQVFKKRLLAEVPPSLQSIADQYGVTRERIRQIEERLIKNLKVYMKEFIR